MNAPAYRFDVEPSVNNHFAWLRTRLGVERTFLAWIRTAISLIGFGFTIVQFFQRLQTMPAINGRQMRPQAPRDLGLALIATGILVLIVSLVQYRGGLSYLWSAPFRGIAGMHETRVMTPAYLAGFVLLAIGIAAFASVFFRFL